MMNSSGNNFQTKQESGGNSKLSKTRRSPSSSRQWGGFKNPRIVCVSRTFGGKDRHSKVCTIRGLRDRRIRLSVPTAIQLYDLQDRLGLSQPSKVVDWLLESTKHEIDKLPPLPIPPGYFTRFQQPPQESVHDLQQLRSHELFNANSSYLKDKTGDFDAGLGASRKNKWIASNDQEENQEDNNVGNRSPNLAGMPFNSYYQWEPNSNLSLAQFGQNSFSSQIEESQNDLPLSLASASQLYFNPIATAPYITNETDLRQLNHFNFLSSTSQYILPNPIFPTTLSLISSPMKPFSLNDGPGWIHSRDDDNDDNQPHEGGVN